MRDAVLLEAYGLKRLVFRAVSGMLHDFSRDAAVLRIPVWSHEWAKEREGNGTASGTPGAGKAFSGRAGCAGLRRPAAADGAASSSQRAVCAFAWLFVSVPPWKFLSENRIEELLMAFHAPHQSISSAFISYLTAKDQNTHPVTVLIDPITVNMKISKTKTTELFFKQSNFFLY